MGKVFEKAKQEQVIALGRLGWSLRQIEAATGVRRETAGGYLRSAEIGLRAPGGWGRKPPSKPANEVITGFLPEATLPEQSVKRHSGASEPYRKLIELELSGGRNAIDHSSGKLNSTLTTQRLPQQLSAWQKCWT